MWITKLPKSQINSDVSFFYIHINQSAHNQIDAFSIMIKFCYVFEMHLGLFVHIFN